MEEESFEDLEIARYMNENYVAIKVDREVRPDLDGIYMASVQALTGRGGWPMTVWLTPERQPFFGGTYFPARDGDRGAAKGFLTLLKDLNGYYDANPGKISELTEHLTGAVRKNLQAEEKGNLPEMQVLDRAVDLYLQLHDGVNGGLQGAPKFPSSLPIGLLLRYHRRTGNPESIRAAELTLEKMAGGGMYDQVGGGFHRYSTDSRWRVPHFEKMLYDNALLVPLYLEGFQQTGRPDFARVAGEILDYVLREMTSPEGGFYSATDADSEGEEGKFFTWSAREILEVVGKEHAGTVLKFFGATERGNYEGRNILHTGMAQEQAAAQSGMQPGQFEAIIGEARKRLYEVRSHRAPPLRDEKILTAWNGLMISALARGAAVLDEPRYAKAAETASRFLLRELRSGGRLLRSHLDGESGFPGYLNDYAFLIAGLIDLYETTFQVEWLKEAIALQESMDTHFRDRENGGYYQTSDDHETLLVREKPDHDGAVPSGNSIAVLNLLRLHEFTTDEKYRQRAEEGFQAFGNSLNRNPSQMAGMLLALDFFLDQPKEIVIVTPNVSGEAAPFLARLRAQFLPNRILAVVPEGPILDAQAAVIPLLKNKIAQKGKATAYVCENRICSLPTNDPEIFAKQIARVGAFPETGGEPPGD